VQASPKHGGPAAAVEEVSADIVKRARVIADETRHELLSSVLDGPVALQALNNALMDVYRAHARVDAYTLLFELNLRPFSMIAARIMRMTGSRGDINDVLQETFLAIYRYPSKFCPAKPNAFRNWSYSIIRNTVYRHLNHVSHQGIPADSLAETLADEHALAPDRVSELAESDQACRRVYALLLSLYSWAYIHELKPRDRVALELVEVQHLGYRQASELLSIRLENFKMIVCRARKKILQCMIRVLGTRQS
jgi:RNA polymerase sigma factor (sigma-70 family)